MELTKNKKILYIAIFFLFAIITYFIGINHEPWADEAQAWLIARENSVFELFFDTLKYEGRPCLWYLILKVFNFIHFPYKYIFLISWSITLVGIYLFLFKIKCPTFIKVLFPFTFFIFYQYNIIARDYCLMFPTLCFTVMTYKNRFEKPFWYALSLILLFSINICTIIIGGFLFLYSIIDLIKNKNSIKKYLTPIVITVLYIIFTILYVNTPADCSFSRGLRNMTILNFDYKFFYILISSYFNTYKNLIFSIIQISIILLLYVQTIKIFCKNKLQTTFLILTNLSILLFLSLVYYGRWHFGFLIIILMFFIMWLTEENNIESIPFKKHWLFYTVVCFLFLLQISWSVKSCIYEINNTYSSGKEVAEFIKKNQYKKEEILGLGYKVVSIQPYFAENIFSNFPDNKAYWKWDYQSDREKYGVQLESKVIVIDKVLCVLNKQQKAHLAKYYDEKIFDSKIYMKGYVADKNSLSVYIRKK